MMKTKPIYGYELQVMVGDKIAPGGHMEPIRWIWQIDLPVLYRFDEAYNLERIFLTDWVAN